MNKTTITPQPKTAPFFPPARGILQRKCACGNHRVAGGECAECAKNKSRLQRKLTIGASNDPLEQEADRIADQVLTAPAHPNAPPLIQRFAVQPATGQAEAPASVDQALASPGRPLEPALRQGMEQRFGYDFSRVRVHSGAAAEQSAKDVSALAYTVGQNIVFSGGQFAQGTNEGWRLIAHELTHVVQQSGSEGIRTGQGNEKSGFAPISDNVNIANSASVDPVNLSFTAHPVPYPQRKMTVSDPDKGVSSERQLTNAETILRYIQTLCPLVKVEVDPENGVVNIVNTRFCTRPWGLSLSSKFLSVDSPAEKSATPTGCGCVCDLVSSGNEWTIYVDDQASSPETVPNDGLAAVGKKGGWGFLNGTGGTITTPSLRNPKRFGVATESGKLERTQAWLIFGHELCGHAWRMNSGDEDEQDATTRGTGGHQEAVSKENDLREEFNITHPLEQLERRANFCGPYCGESFWHNTANSSTPQWIEDKAPGRYQGMRFRDLCQKVRDSYNDRHETEYNIKDKLPDDCFTYLFR